MIPAGLSSKAVELEASTSAGMLPVPPASKFQLMMRALPTASSNLVVGGMYHRSDPPSPKASSPTLCHPTYHPLSETVMPMTAAAPPQKS